MTNTDNATNERTLLNKVIIWIVHTCGVSGIIVIVAIYEIGRLSTSMSAGTHTEQIADLTVVFLWAWLKFLAPLAFHYIVNPIKARLPDGIF